MTKNSRIYFRYKKSYYNASVVLLPHGFKVFSDSLSYLFISCFCEIWQLLILRSLTCSQCLTDVHWISGWYILVMKQLTKFTVEVNCRFNKENNNLESSILNTIKHIRNGAWHMAILLEVWFNYFSNHKHKP